MAHLLHIDSSVQGDQSVSRRLTARAAARWRVAHRDGTVTYRDLATDPIPHFTPSTGAQLSAELIDEIKHADTILLGLPLYNFGPPSTVKAWVDHIVAPGLSIDAETGAGLLGDTDFVVLASRGGGYGPGTPREGWDHAQAWSHPDSVSLTGLAPRLITAELTMAGVNPAMAELRPLAAQASRNASSSRSHTSLIVGKQGTACHSRSTGTWPVTAMVAECNSSQTPVTAPAISSACATRPTAW